MEDVNLGDGVHQELGPALKSGPARKSGPALESGPAQELGPALESGPARKSCPALESGPARQSVPKQGISRFICRACSTTSEPADIFMLNGDLPGALFQSQDAASILAGLVFLEQLTTKIWNMKY